MNHRRLLPILACSLLWCRAASAADPAAPVPPPLPPPPADAPAGTVEGEKQNWKQMNGMVEQILDQDPIGRITGRMGKAADLLGKLTTDKPTQTVQKNIVVELDDFITMLEKRKKKRKSGSGSDPSDPLPDSILAKGPGGEGNLKDPNASARLWGQLPPKQREQILQSQNEGFPPGYEAILSSYYKRLAQENVENPPTAAAAGATPPAAVPATRPAQPR